MAQFLLTAIGMRITQYARVLGKGGEQHVEELLAKIKEGAKNQPVVTMKMISECISRLGKQAAWQK